MKNKMLIEMRHSLIFISRKCFSNYAAKGKNSKRQATLSSFLFPLLPKERTHYEKNH